MKVKIITELLRPIDIEKMAGFYSQRHFKVRSGSSRYILKYRDVKCVEAYFIFDNSVYMILKYKTKYNAFYLKDYRYCDRNLLDTIKLMEEIKYNPNIRILDESIKQSIIEKNIINKI